MRRLFTLAAVILALGASPLEGQSRSYYHQTYLPAAHNWAFARQFPEVDGLFNAFDYGHSVLYETLWRNPAAPAEMLDVREFGFITTKLLRDPPRVPLDEAGIGPGWTLVAPEVKAIFEWAHMLHRQLYDIIADDRIRPADRDARVGEVLAYYKSRPILALSSFPKGMDLMEGQSYSLAFKKRFPKYNGLIWSYHWLQMTIYDAMMEGTSVAERRANVKAVTDRFREMTDGGMAALPSVMPMSPAIAPTFSAAYPEAAIIFDNLHSLHDVVSDIFANPAVPRSRKRQELLAAAGRYRDSTSSITTVDEWRQMSVDMGLEEMGGAAPIARRQSPAVAAPAAPHKH